MRKLSEVAFSLVDLDWERHVRIDERYLRPTGVSQVCGERSKAPGLGWEARATFRELVRLMLEQDLAEAGINIAMPTSTGDR